jgi:hypothetical protein
MKGIPYNPTSARAIRGKNWEAVLFKDMCLKGFNVQKTWDMYKEKYPYMNDATIALNERKEGDIIVSLAHKTIHFECIVCPMPGRDGYFPEHKRNNFYSKEGEEKWYAFMISSDGLTGEQYFIPAGVWNSYSGKLPKNNWNGKDFRIYNAKIIKSIRAAEKSLNNIL